jgi:cytoskeletal protein RodZ
MTLIILEALLALLILVGIVWWTMFSGRTKGEIRSRNQTDQTESGAISNVIENNVIEKHHS